MFDLRVNVRAKVLEALPSASVALEVDTNGRDVHNTEPKHLCSNIRAIAPRLHSLRRRDYLWPTIIYTKGLKYLSSKHHISPDRLGTADNDKAPELQTVNASFNNAWRTL